MILGPGQLDYILALYYIQMNELEVIVASYLIMNRIHRIAH